MEIDAMSTAQSKRRYTPEEYLALERKAEYKSEYLDGEIFAMSGASFPHNLITVNLIREIGTKLRGEPCRILGSDMRLLVSRTGLYTYPDLVAYSGKPAFLDEEFDTLTNPVLIIEVLSPSTESYDRGKKFKHYAQIHSLSEYLLVSQNHVYVERFARRGDDWLFSQFDRVEHRLHLHSINCELVIGSIYEGVTFSEDEPETNQQGD
jgi:Uma2 family endonuclease